jgi:predicted metal-binding membrane protein
MNEPTTAPAAVPATVGALTTLGLGAAAWVVALRQMNGMDMGIATELGSLRSFVGVWVAMMAAMMLPGAALALFRRGRVRGLPLFVVAYLGVWTVVGLVFVQKLLREHPIVDVPVALAIVGLGIVIVGSPSVVPGLEPTM